MSNQVTVTADGRERCINGRTLIVFKETVEGETYKNAWWMHNKDFIKKVETMVDAGTDVTLYDEFGYMEDMV